MAGRQVIQDRIYGRQVGGAGGISSNHLLGYLVEQVDDSGGYPPRNIWWSRWMIQVDIRGDYSRR